MAQKFGAIQRTKKERARARSFADTFSISKTFQASGTGRFFPQRQPSPLPKKRTNRNTPQRNTRNLTQLVRGPTPVSLSFFVHRCLESRQSKCMGTTRFHWVREYTHCLEMRAASTSLKFAWVQSVGSGSGSGSGARARAQVRVRVGRAWVLILATGTPTCTPWEYHSGTWGL